MDLTMDTSSFTEDEKAYHQKFNAVIENSKILTLPYIITCAICEAVISRDQITDNSFHKKLYIVLCKKCAVAKRATSNKFQTASRCDWCGANSTSKTTRSSKSRLTNCVRDQCDGKFCEICVEKLRKLGRRVKLTARSSYCIFCLPSIIREERAICGALLANMKKMREELEDRECIICCENEAKIRFIPCGHMCVCSVCLPAYKEKFVICPKCRGEYKDAVDVQSGPAGKV